MVDGHVLKGALVEVRTDVLVLSSRPPVRRKAWGEELLPMREVPLDSIDRVVVRRLHAASAGALVGAGFGAGLGILVSIIAGSEGGGTFGPSPESLAPFIVGIPMTIGGLLGLGGSLAPELEISRQKPEGAIVGWERGIRNEVFRSDVRGLREFRIEPLVDGNCWPRH